MSKKPKIYVENPVILDLKKHNITPLGDDEIFVMIPYKGLENYYISSWGRCYSKLRDHMLKQQMYGNNRGVLRPSYKLRGNNNKYKNYFTHVLVAEVFCKKIKSSRKIEIHHKDFDTNNSHYSNLEYIELDRHRSLHSGKEFYLYDLEKGTFKHFKSFLRLCNYTSVNYKRTYMSMYRKEPDFKYFNGLSGYVIESEEYKELPLHIGIKKLYEKEKSNISIDENAKVNNTKTYINLFIGALIVSKLISLNKNKRRMENNK